MRELLNGFRIQLGIIGALFMREIQLRWGRRNLGFAWLFAEPLVFAFPVLVMWSLIRGSATEHGVQILPFLWSGYLPLLMFRHTTGHALDTIRHNGALLYHRQVSPLDLMIARLGLELIGSTSALVFSFIVLYMLGYLPWPKNYPLMMVGVLYMAWWSFSVGLLVGALSERTEMVHHIWAPVSYMYLPVSGFIYLADWLPPTIRNIALTVLPSLHSYEMIRGGLFGNFVQVHYDVQYVTYVLTALTLLGLWQIRHIRKYLSFDGG